MSLKDDFSTNIPELNFDVSSMIDEEEESSAPFYEKKLRVTFEIKQSFSNPVVKKYELILDQFVWNWNSSLGKFALSGEDRINKALEITTAFSCKATVVLEPKILFDDYITTSSIDIFYDDETNTPKLEIQFSK